MVATFHSGGINPTTVADEVYRKIKRMIARRELEPGTRLVLRTLAKQVGASTQPVIEAVRRLEHDGLITQIPKWGAYVKKWSDQERLEAYHIRQALEGEAARLFVLTATPEAKERLIELGRRFDELALTDPVACDEADIAIHLHVAWSTRFTRLAEMIEASNVATATIFGNFWEERLPDYRSKAGIHQELISSLLGDDPELAASVMRQHIGSFLSTLQKSVG